MGGVSLHHFESKNALCWTIKKFTFLRGIPVSKMQAKLVRKISAVFTHYEENLKKKSRNVLNLGKPFFEKFVSTYKQS